uniref:YoaK family protein n=1 Tax=Paractinoplanes polyasparticus TaxID=2856853 RepID=UPI001C85E7D4|nr:YoaK family protein [Actinoplanes polyasparticus]
MSGVAAGSCTGSRLRRRFGTPPALMLALTFATGIVDAVGYLHLDKVFAGNMTGNVVILGMAASGRTDLPVLGPLLALAFFLVGAATGGRVLRAALPNWNRRCTGLLGGVGLVLAATALGLALIGVGTLAARAAMASALALAMGMQAATARHLAVRDVSTVVVTSTLTSLAADSRLGAARGQPALRRASAVVLIAVGAITGAALCQMYESVAVAVAALVVLAVTGLGHAAARCAGHAAAATTGSTSVSPHDGYTTPPTDPTRPPRASAPQPRSALEGR